MSDVKRTLKHLVIMYLLVFINMLLNIGIVPYDFPFRYLPVLFVLFLSTFLVFYYSLIVAPRSNMRWLMIGIAVMIVMLTLFQAMKYSIIFEAEILARYLWYLYYVPMIMISVFLFYISICVFEKDERYIPWKYSVFFIIALALILLVLTNDFHQMVFRFNNDFVDWNRDYTYGIGFYFVEIFQYGIFVLAVLILLARCRIREIRGRSWLLLIPFLLGVTAILLLVTGEIPKINGCNIIEVPEAYCFMVAGVLECCLQLGLVPSNLEYKKIFHISSIAAQIIDQDKNVVYQSKDAPSLAKEQYALRNGARIEPHKLIRRIDLPGGMGIWIEDVEELDHLNEQLTEAGSRLYEEMELVRLQNEWKEKQAKITQRTILYDEIAKNTYQQSRLISEIAKASQNSTDPITKEKGRKRIALLSTYVKRYANLMLLSDNHQVIDIGELALSFAEILRRVNRYGIPGELFNTARSKISSSAVLTIFEIFEYLLESSMHSLSGIYVTLSDEVCDVSCKITLENAMVQLSPELIVKMEAEQIQNEVEYEDHVTYMRMVLPRGGDVL